MSQTSAASPNPVNLVANIATALLGGARPLSRNPVANQIASTTMGIASFGLAPLALSLFDRPKKKNDPLKPIKDMERVIRKALAGNRPLTAKEQAYFLKAERSYADRRVGRFPEQDDVFGTTDQKDLMRILLHHQTFGDYRARDVLRAVKPYSVKHRRSDKPQRQRLIPVSPENAIRRAQLFETIPPIAEPERGRRWNRDNVNFERRTVLSYGGRRPQPEPRITVDVEKAYQQLDAYNALFPEPVAPAPMVPPTPEVPAMSRTPALPSLREQFRSVPVTPGPIRLPQPGDLSPNPVPGPNTPGTAIARAVLDQLPTHSENYRRPDMSSITGVNTSSFAQTIGTIGDTLEGLTRAIAPAIPGILQATIGGRRAPVMVPVGTQPGAVGVGLNPFGTAQPFVDSPVMPGGTTPVFGGMNTWMDLPFIDLAPQGSQGGGAPTTPFRMTASGNQVAQPFVNTRANGTSEWFIPAGKPKTWTKANVKRRRSCRPR